MSRRQTIGCSIRKTLHPVGAESEEGIGFPPAVHRRNGFFATLRPSVRQPDPPSPHAKFAISMDTRLIHVSKSSAQGPPELHLPKSNGMGGPVNHSRVLLVPAGTRPISIEDLVSLQFSCLDFFGFSMSRSRNNAPLSFT